MTSLIINAVSREWSAVSMDNLSADISVEVSAEGVISLSGGTGAGGFSRGRPSILCSSRAPVRKASALRGKTVGEKRLQLGTKKWGRTPLRAWSSRAPRRYRKQAGSLWRAHMESLNLTGNTQGKEDIRRMRNRKTQKLNEWLEIMILTDFLFPIISTSTRPSTSRPATYINPNTTTTTVGLFLLLQLKFTTI